MKKTRWDWASRWGGAACAVAGCMPMLFALLAGTAGATGAQAMNSTMMMGTPVPSWVTALGSVSWPLLILSVALLVWSFWRTPAAVRIVAYFGVLMLVVNQFSMRPWLFFPALALLAAGFALAYARRQQALRIR